jgi:hypothetical protein
VGGVARSCNCLYFAGFGRRVDCGRAGPRTTLHPTGVERLEDIPRFPTTRAFKLYQQILAPAEPLLDGVTHVIAVPNGAVASLPVGVLVTEASQKLAATFGTIATFLGLPNAMR